MTDNLALDNEIFIKIPAEVHPQGGWFHENNAIQVKPRELTVVQWYPA